MAVKKISNNYSSVILELLARSHKIVARYSKDLVNAQEELVEYLQGEYKQVELTPTEKQERAQNRFPFGPIKSVEELRNNKRKRLEDYIEWFSREAVASDSQWHYHSERIACLNKILPYYEQPDLQSVIYHAGQDKWVYLNCLFEVKGAYSEDEQKLLILEFADKERQQFERLKAKFSGEQAKIATTERKRIPEDVRIAVWRRDQGQCSRCGGRESLEYDHIIPHSRGGSDTVRNIELLCERCNREKSDRIQ